MVHAVTRCIARALGLLAVCLLLALAPGAAAAQSLHDDPAFTLYRDAVEAFERKDYARAAALAGESLTHYPDNLQAHYLAGQAALAQERWEEAAAAFRKVIALSPTSFAGHRELGIALAELARLDEAARALEKALALRPQAQDVQRRLAFLQLQAGNHEAAFGHLRALADGGTKEPDVWAALGRLHYDRKELRASEKAFSQAAALGDDARVWFNLGVVRLRLDDEQGALEAFRRAARDPELKAQATEQIARIEERLARASRGRSGGTPQGEPGGARPAGTADGTPGRVR